MFYNYMFRPFSLGHLQVVHKELINKLDQLVWGVYSLWGGVGARSRSVLEKGVWTGVVLGIVLNHSCLLTAMSISGLHFWYVHCILEKLYNLWTKSKVLLYYIYSFTYLGLIVYYLYLIWKRPTLMAETCSCTLVIVNVLQGI